VGGFAIGGTAAGFTLAIEHVKESQKSVTATALNVYNHVAGYTILVGIHLACVHVKASWKTELFGFASCLGLLVVTTALVVPESPEFLARRAKPRGSSSLGAADDGASAPTSSDGMQRLLDPSFQRSTATLTLCFVAGVVIYYSLSFSAGAISDNLILNIFLLSVLGPSPHARTIVAPTPWHGRTARIA
jgi:hypothetical protein